MLFLPGYASLELVALAKQKKEKRQVKILQIKKRDGIKSKEARPGWGEAHNVHKACVGTTEGF